jgi:hypothetical protein
MKPFALVLLLLAVTTATARSQGVRLGWDDTPSRGGAVNRMSDCASNSGTQTFVVTFSPPMDLPGVTDLDLTLLVHGSFPTSCDPFFSPPGTNCGYPSITPFWQLDAGGCRSGALKVSADFTPDPWGTSTTVLDPWGGAAITAPWSYVVEAAGTAPTTWTQGRLRVHLAPMLAPSVDLLAGQEYYLVRADITSKNSTGTGACDGCCAPAHVTLSSLIVNAPGVSPVPIIVTTLEAPLMWQGYGNGSCVPVPTRSGTWGALKSTYR